MTDSDIQYVYYDIDIIDYSKTKIKTKSYSKNDVTYEILNYDKNILCEDDAEYGLYRSIIVALPEKQILCFSPPKSVIMDNFIVNACGDRDNIYVNETIEGTMINLFYDYRIHKWEISTKSAIGGNYFYYRNQYELDDDKTKKQTSFYRMFLDALRLGENQELNDFTYLENLPKNYSYSFVLQHPDNHIVLSVNAPTLHLVGVYEITNKNHIVSVSPNIYEEWDIFKNIQGVIDFPKRFTFTSYNEMEDTYCSIQQSFNYVGLTFLNLKTGERTTMANPTYEEMKVLRGNNPNLQYQYLCLRRINKVKDFLYYFPQYRSVFFKFYEDFNNFVSNVHLSYLTYYVQKQEVQISKKYFPHIYRIHHNVFLPSLQTEEPLIIRRKVVKEYFDEMEPRELIYHLNYDKREYGKQKEQKEEK
jgi:hypothetical protein